MNDVHSRKRDSPPIFNNTELARGPKILGSLFRSMRSIEEYMYQGKAMVKRVHPLVGLLADPPAPWRRGRASLCVLLGLVGVTLSCGRSSGPPNVLLISLDTLRADRLGSYGYSRDTSPFLDELAAAGTIFSRMSVNTHGTPPSHASLFTSLYQQTHRVSLGGSPRNIDRHILPKHLATLAEILQSVGYVAVGSTGGSWISRKMQFDQGFEAFNDKNYRGVATRANALVKMVANRGKSGKPLFAFFHTFEIHGPYSPPKKYRDMFGTYDSDFVPSAANLARIFREQLPITTADGAFITSQYDAGIRYADDTLREMFRRLDELGFLDNCLVLVTSDHGESLGERGHYSHPSVLYRELVDVPLIIAGPEIPAGGVDDRLISTIDIAPTILDYVNVEIPDWFQGRSALLPPKPGADQVTMAQYGSYKFAITTLKWKLIRTPVKNSLELFNLVADPLEGNNVADQHPGVVRDLDDRISAWLARQAPREAPDEKDPPELTEEEIKRLKTLGYL